MADEHGPEPAEHVTPRRPGLGALAEQVDAERVEVVGNVGDQLAGGRGFITLLVHEDLHITANERQAAREGFVEHDTDAVPVARGRDRRAGRLFGGHVGCGSDHLIRGALVQAPPPLLCGESEVEQDDSARSGHHHV